MSIVDYSLINNEKTKRIRESTAQDYLAFCEQLLLNCSVCNKALQLDDISNVPRAIGVLYPEEYVLINNKVYTLCCSKTCREVFELTLPNVL